MKNIYGNNLSLTNEFVSYINQASLRDLGTQILMMKLHQIIPKG